MDFGSKQSFSLTEKLLMKTLIPLGNLKYKGVKRKHYKKFLTVKEICNIADIDISQLNDSVKKVLNKKVSGAYRASSRFIKDCICVQLYEDGDGVMRWAASHGATVCVTSHNIEDIPCIVAENPAAVYSDICSYYRKRNPIEATTIVGSIGKTTTKKMVESVYKTQFETFCDAGNDNQIDGVGYFAQHIPERAEKWVQEVSEDTPGCVKEISKIVMPSINIVTAIDKSHIEEYGDENGILDEIRSIKEGMLENAVNIVSKDEDNTATLFSEKDNVIFVSVKDEQADYYAKDIVIKNDGMHFSVTDKKQNRDFPVFLPNVFAEHNVYSALYAFAAGVCAGVSYDNIVKGLSLYKATGIRQNVYRAKGMTVYADCYNAVAKSIRSAVEACDGIPVTGKRIAVIGDVEEAGDFSEAVHKEIVEIINNSRFDVLLTFGEKMEEAVKTTEVRSNLEVKSFFNKSKLNSEIRKYIEKDGLILFKASHKSRLDTCISAIFPMAYFKNIAKSSLPQITHRLKVIKSWTI
ncbi:MAG: hypothetical protein IK057_04910 [Clostridia bacterium]|nr:hypothetical protein [Clostridia bacterium]